MKRAILAVLLVLIAAGCGSSSTQQPPQIVAQRAGALLASFGSAASPTVNEVLTTTTGTWTNTPTSFTYQWQRCTSLCSNISGATSSSYTVQAADVGDTIDVVVTATNSAGSASQTSASTGVVTSSSGNPTLPSGVTLVAIDGDTLNANDTQSGYYCNTAFGTTVTSSNNVACLGGWDSSTFFPIADWWETNYTAAAWTTLGWNTAVKVNNQTEVNTLASNGQFLIMATDSGNLPSGQTPNSGTVGFITYDEPNTWTSAISGMGAVPNASQDGRFWFVNNTWSYMGFANVPSGVPNDNTLGTQSAEFTDPVTTPNGQTRHIDMGSVDLYWFANSGADSPTIGGDLYGTSTLSTAQTMCGCRYGDMIRPVYGTSVGMQANKYEGAWHTTPIFAYVETADAFISGHKDITPAEVNWAVWSSINHGARGIIYFDKATAPCNTYDYATSGCGSTVYSPNVVSIHQQIVTTDSLVKSFASEINSPTALSYATVSPAPTTFGGIETRSVFDTNSTDCSGAASCFYVFADTRDAEVANGGPSNISATYTIAGNYAGSVPVQTQCGAGGTVSSSVTVASHQFTDSFANADCTKIYGPIPNQ